MLWDQKALKMVEVMERSIKRLDLDSQGQFVAIFNAIEMQIESGRPAFAVVNHLTNALLDLATVRRVDADALGLHDKVEALLNRLAKAKWR